MQFFKTAFVLCSIICWTAYGLTSTWKGQDTEWKESYNWTNGVPKNAGDVAHFSSTSGQTLVGIKNATSLGQLQFNIEASSHVINLETVSPGVLTFRRFNSEVRHLPPLY